MPTPIITSKIPPRQPNSSHGRAASVFVDPFPLVVRCRRGRVCACRDCEPVLWRGRGDCGSSYPLYSSYSVRGRWRLAYPFYPVHLIYLSLSAVVLAVVHQCKPVAAAHPVNNLLSVPVNNPGRMLGAGVAGVVPDQNRRLDVGASGVADMVDVVALAASAVYADVAPPCHNYLAASPVHRPSCCPVPCGRYSCGMLVSLSDWPSFRVVGADLSRPPPIYRLWLTLPINRRWARSMAPTFSS